MYVLIFPYKFDDDFENEMKILEKQHKIINLPLANTEEVNIILKKEDKHSLNFRNQNSIIKK